MKVFLLYKNQDFNQQQRGPWNENELRKDLELDVLFKAMSAGDEFLYKTSEAVFFAGIKNDVTTILYRQEILKDCLKNSSLILSLYKYAVDAIENRRTSWYSIFASHPSSILSGSIGMLGIFVEVLKQLRGIADEHSGKFESKGFIRFFAMLQKELGDDYFAEVEAHLEELRFKEGILISAQLGKGNKGIHYLLRKFHGLKLTWFQRLFAEKEPGYSFDVHPRDESGARALSNLTNEGINEADNTVAQSADHILSFLKVLQFELAFYIGCINLHEQLLSIQESICFPVPAVSTERKFSFIELYDACLALSMKHKIVGNDMNAGKKNLVIITGANQGGKSTFLRSIGLSQLMMQSGMFVGAESFSSTIVDSLFTHFKREEDASMESGKLDEELKRMSDVTDHITSNSLLLFNESFAATNEREGSEIARQIVNALLEKNLMVFFVTHLYELSHGFYETKKDNAIFLRAERQTDKTRSFKLTEAEPLPTSYGIDLYDKIFVSSHQETTIKPK
jgi:DNA mismatch repair ATPase MutS